MKKTTLLKSMLLLCALIVGSGSVCGDPTTRMTKSAHRGAYSNELFVCFLKFRFEVVVRLGIKAIKMSCRLCFHIATLQNYEIFS